MNGRLEHENKLENNINNMLEYLPDYVSEWHYHLKASRKTVSTRVDYVRKVKQFLDTIDNDLDNLTANAVYSYLTDKQTKTTEEGEVYTSDSYQQTIWNCLNNFFGYLKKQKYIEKNYMEYIDRPKNRDLDRINQNRKLLTKKDFKKIIEAIEKAEDTKEPYKCRDKALIMLLMTTGMRREALSEINVQDLDLCEEKLTIVDKGNKRHLYALNEELVNDLDNWMKYRENIAINTDSLFVSYQGGRMSGTSVANVVKKYSEKALGYSISPHKLRAGFCSILYKETHDAEFVRRAVGHANIATTQRYITTNNKEREVASSIMASIF